MSKYALELCDSGHDEVCFGYGSDCPVCAVQEELDDNEYEYEQKLKELEEEIDDLKDELKG